MKIYKLSADLDNYDALIIPGGMPGATNISSCEKAVKAIKKAVKVLSGAFGLCIMFQDIPDTIYCIRNSKTKKAEL